MRLVDVRPPVGVSHRVGQLFFNAVKPKTNSSSGTVFGMPRKKCPVISPLPVLIALSAATIAFQIIQFTQDLHISESS